MGNIVKPVILNSHSAIIEAMDQCDNTGNRHYRILMEDSLTDMMDRVDLGNKEMWDCETVIYKMQKMVYELVWGVKC